MQQCFLHSTFCLKSKRFSELREALCKDLATHREQSNYNYIHRLLSHHTRNSAARVIFGGERREHATPLLRDRLHWLRARERITFKLCLLVYKAHNGMAPNYIEDLCLPVSSVSTRAALRSAARGDRVIAAARGDCHATLGCVCMIM